MYSLTIETHPGEVRLKVVHSPLSGAFKTEPSSQSGFQSKGGSAQDTEPPSFTPQAKRPAKPPNFTLVGKRKLKWLTRAIDHFSSEKLRIFATATFPVWSEEAQAALASQSSYFCDRLQSWLYKIQPKIPLTYCWEFQRRGALHLHLVCGAESVEKRDRIIAGWKQECTRLIDAMSSRTGVNLWQGKTQDWSKQPEKLKCEAEIVRKSASGYLAKYLSKGSGTRYRSKAFYPSRWWGASKGARDWCSLLTSTKVLAIGSASKCLAMKESLLGDLAPACQYWTGFRHRFGLGSTNVLFGLEPDAIAQISGRKHDAKEMKCTMLKPLESFTRRENLEYRLLFMMRKDESGYQRCLEQSSTPLKQVLTGFISSQGALPTLTLEDCLELRSLIPLSYGRRVLTRELQASCSQLVKTYENSGVPVLREPKPAVSTRCQRSPTSDNGHADSERYHQYWVPGL